MPLAASYRLEAVKGLGRDPETSCLDGAGVKAVKIVAPLLPHLPLGRNYRIVFMERPLKDNVASQTAMLKNLGKAGGKLGERQLAAAFLKQVDQVRGVLAGHPDRVKILAVDYAAAVADSEHVARELNRFLDEAAMVRVVAPELRRQRAS